MNLTYVTLLQEFGAACIMAEEEEPCRFVAMPFNLSLKDLFDCGLVAAHSEPLAT